jgi:hypothetical protein
VNKRKKKEKEEKKMSSSDVDMGGTIKPIPFSGGTEDWIG